MSWLSGGLSQFSSLTDQISSFTKDVITETTEEIEDPAAELQVARKMIAQLEEVNSHYKTEWEKLQRHSEEVRERAETAECQIATISQEYRKLIQEKDSELVRLRNEAASLKEQQRRFMSGEAGAEISPLKDLATGGRNFFPESSSSGTGGGERGEGKWEVAMLEPVAAEGGGGWEGGGRGEEERWGDYHDFGDVISSQGEINRLQLELSKLKVENKHWRTLAEEKGHGADSVGPVEVELASLRRQVEELQLCLQQERGQHQHQLSLLKAARQEKDSSATHTTGDQEEEERESGEGRVQKQLREAMGDGAEGASGAENTTVRGSLLSSLEEVSLDERDGDGGAERRGGEADKEMLVSLLQSELDSSQEKCATLERKVEGLNTELKEICNERREKEGELAEEVSRLKAWNAALERERAVDAGLTGEELERLREKVKCLEEEKASLLAGEQATSQLQLELKNTQIANEDLKAAMEQLDVEKQELNRMTSQLTTRLYEHKELSVKLHSEVERLKQQSAQERETYTRHAEQEKRHLTAVIAELESRVSEHRECIETLRDQCERSRHDSESLATQISELVAQIREKDHQLEDLQGRGVGESSKDHQMERLQGQGVGEVSTAMEQGKLRDADSAQQEEEIEGQLEVTALKEELLTSEEKKTELGRLLQDREARITKLEVESKEAKLQLMQVVAELTVAETALTEKDLVIEQRERNLHDVGKLLAATEEELTSLRRDFEKERKRSQTAGHEMVPQQAEVDGGAELQTATRERDELLRKVESDQNEIRDLGTQLLEAREALDTATNELREVMARNKELEHGVESVRGELGDVRRERDVLTERVRVLEETAGRAGEELAAKQAECGKLAKQLEHLKSHLVQVEDQYVQEALRAEEREKEERQRAQQLEDTLRNTSYARQQENLQTKARVVALEEQLHALAGQRDEAVMELSTAREEAERDAAALRNLQSVLEQFHRDQSSELSVALKRSQMELAAALTERDTLRSHNMAVQTQLQEARAREGVTGRQLRGKDTRLEELQREVSGLQTTLQRTEKALERLMQQECGQVDQNLVKNLVLGYVQASDHKKPEVLKLIAKILNFSPHELQQVQVRRSGWLSGLWSRRTPPSPAAVSPKLPIQGSSLSQLFVSFLETESSPTLTTSPSSVVPLHLHRPPIGRVDTQTDPDRPSRATAANPPALPSSSVLPPPSTSLSSSPTSLPSSSSILPPPPTSLPSSSSTLPQPPTSSSMLPQPLTSPTLFPIHSYANTPTLPDLATTQDPRNSNTSAQQPACSNPPMETASLQTSQDTGSVPSSSSTPMKKPQPRTTALPITTGSTSHANQSSILKDLLS